MILNDEGRRCIRLITAVEANGIEVPESVNAEAQIFHNSAQALRLAKARFEEATAVLEFAEIEDFETCRAEVVSAAQEVVALQNSEVVSAIASAVTRRLKGQVYSAAIGWQNELVRRFNAIVSEYGLNDIGGSLPDLLDPNFRVMGITGDQMHAITQWREASERLRPLWETHRQIADIYDRKIGPSNERAVNFYTACTLGDPGSLESAWRAADHLGSLGSFAHITVYQEISPFLIPSVAGYPLELNSHGVAEAIKTRLDAEYYEVMLGASSGESVWS